MSPASFKILLPTNNSLTNDIYIYICVCVCVCVFNFFFYINRNWHEITRKI